MAHPDCEKRKSFNAARDRPQRGTVQVEAKAYTGQLDGLKIHCAGVAFAVLADIIAKALTDRWSNVLVPLDRALFKDEIVAARFLLDLAEALARVE